MKQKNKMEYYFKMWHVRGIASIFDYHKFDN